MKSDFDNATLQQLTAFLDGELAAHERVELERRLAAEPPLRQLLECWRQDALAMGDLPAVRLPQDFYEQVLAALPEAVAWETEVGMSAQARRSKTRQSGVIGAASDTQRQATRTAAALVLALAGMLLLTLTLGPGWSEPSLPLAKLDDGPAAAPKAAKTGPTGPGAAELDPVANAEAAPEAEDKPPRTLVRPPLQARIRQPRVARSGAVEPIRRPIKQVLILSVDIDAGERDALESKLSVALAKAGIRMVQPAGDRTSLPASRQPLLGAYWVDAPVQQLRSAVDELPPGWHTNVQGVLANPIAEPRLESESPTGLAHVARRPETESVTASDDDQERLLDQWFGLIDEGERLSRTLLIVFGQR